MDGRLATGALLAIPVLYALLSWLTATLPPLAGAGLGLMAYWLGLAVALWRVPDADTLWALARAEPPGRLVSVMLALPVLVLGAGTLRLLGTTVVPAHLLLAAAIAATVTATLEELFWRGILLPRPTPRAAALALGLFWIFHLAWLGARGIETGLSPAVLLLGPLALGGVWTAARLASGTLGAGILGHAGVNLFLFVEVAARNWSAT